MKKKQNPSEFKAFDTYPAPLDKVTEYTILNSRSADVKGHYLTKNDIPVASTRIAEQQKQVNSQKSAGAKSSLQQILESSKRTQECFRK